MQRSAPLRSPCHRSTPIPGRPALSSLYRRINHADLRPAFIRHLDPHISAIGAISPTLLVRHPSRRDHTRLHTRWGATMPLIVWHRSMIQTTMRLWAVVSMLAGSRAWEFPRPAALPQHAAQHPFALDDDDVDIVSGSQFRGLKTFANLPYLNCISDEETEHQKYDIAIMGAPFDTVSFFHPSFPISFMVSWCHATVSHWAARSSVRANRDPNRKSENVSPRRVQRLYRCV